MSVEVISPHFDDAALSCWSLIEQPNSSVVTVFGGIPAAGTNAAWDRLCGEPDSAALMHKRIDENQRVLAAAEADVINLPYLDKQYASRPRDIEEMTEAVLASTPDEVELYLPVAVASRIRRHPDHLCVQAMAKLFMDKGRSVSFYADLPYALPAVRLDNWADRTPVEGIERSLDTKLELEIHELTPEQQTRKWAAVRGYESQFAMVNTLAVGALSRRATYRQEAVFKQV